MVSEWVAGLGKCSGRECFVESFTGRRDMRGTREFSCEAASGHPPQGGRHHDKGVLRAQPQLLDVEVTVQCCRGSSKSPGVVEPGS